MSLLVICEILRQFANTLIAYDKYPLPNTENLRQPIYIQLSKKRKIFSEPFAKFLKSRTNFTHFEKKITPIAFVFTDLQTAKDVVRQGSKKLVSEHP